MHSDVRLNAYPGEPPRASAASSQIRRWIGSEVPLAAQVLRAPPSLADPARWLDAEVGWGLVLPEVPGLSAAALATADDAPEPIQRLLAHREGVVLRWSPGLEVSRLRRYYNDGGVQDPHLALAPRGKDRGRVPRYLLLYGGPEVLPWSLQYRLGASAFVGRLDLDGAPLANYVDAAISDWDGAGASASRALTWAVDHGGDDITALMRTVVAKKLHSEFAADTGMQAAFLDGRAEPATGEALIAALEDQRPGMIVTTSHGMTGPLNDVPSMQSRMGLPVDAAFRTLDSDALLAQWAPDGAIWYAQACCSAGSDAHSAYEGLVDPTSQAGEILAGVARCGALVAPLPRLLLGAPRPLRAFLGHVEPTFDWTLKDRSTGQVLTDSLAQALYRRLYQPFPIGYAIESIHDKAPQLHGLHLEALRRTTQSATPAERQASEQEALTCRLVAQDLQSLVLLGDPATGNTVP